MISWKHCAVLVCMLTLGGGALAQTQGDANKGQAQQQNAQPEQPKPNAPQPTVGLPSGQPQTTKQGLPKSEVYEANCEKPGDHDAADLCVQRRVAEVAQNTYQLTLAQTVIGAFGLIAVIVTLGFTAWTGKAASLAAQAAMDAVGAERAWISFVTTQLSVGWLQNPPRPGEISFGMLVTNAGRSPAIEVNIFREAQLIDANSEMPNFTAIINPAFQAPIGPGITFPCMPFEIGGQDVDDFINRRKFMAFYLKVNYKAVDSPKVERTTEVSGWFEFRGVRTKPDGSPDPIIPFIPRGPQNSAT